MPASIKGPKHAISYRYILQHRGMTERRSDSQPLDLVDNDRSVPEVEGPAREEDERCYARRNPSRPAPDAKL